MKKQLYIIPLICGFILFSVRPAFSGLPVSDALTKAEDIIEKVTEVLKTAEEKVSDAESALRDSKIGEFGNKALNGYNYINDRLTLGRNLLAGDLKQAPLDVPAYLKVKTNDVVAGLAAI